MWWIIEHKIGESVEASLSVVVVNNVRLIDTYFLCHLI
jgi:hypothetical protein